MTAWQVFDAADSGEGRQIGLFYLDMHPREGKDKWFSAASLVPGIRGRQYPEAALICNFPGGKDGDPGLMQYSDVVTYFHEFGHLMHAILGGDQAWAGISGIRTEWDFVEAPSQMLEEFFRDPKLLASFARHYETGEALPAETVQRMNRASAFGRADSIRTQLVYTSYSLDTHNIDPETLDLDTLLRIRIHAVFSVRLDRGQSDVFELRPPGRVLVELLHLSIRQGDRAGFLCPVRRATTCWKARRRCAIVERCSNRAARSRLKSLSRIFLGGSRAWRRSRRGLGRNSRLLHKHAHTLTSVLDTLCAVLEE